MEPTARFVAIAEYAEDPPHRDGEFEQHFAVVPCLRPGQCCSDVLEFVCDGFWPNRR